MAAPPAAEASQSPLRPGPALLRRILLVVVTTLLVARPLVLGEDPGLLAEQSDPGGMVLTLLWLVAAAGWAVWRFWLRPQTNADGVLQQPSGEGAVPWNWYGSIVQTVLLAVVGLVFLSAEVAAHYKFPARLIAWEWFGLFVAFLVVQQMAVSQTEQRGLFAVLLAGAVSLAAQGVYQAVVELPRNRQLGEDPEALRAAWAEERGSEEVSESFIEQLRQRTLMNNVFGPYAHPNSYAGYLVLWLPGLIGAVFTCWRTRVPRWQTILAIVCVLLGVTALWLTHSRGALLALALTGLGTVVLLYRATLRTHLIVTLAGLVVIVGLAVGAGQSGLLTTAMGKGSNTITQRLEYWQTTWSVIRERPWLGVGPGNFRENYNRVMADTALESLTDPHNFLLEAWATSGVFAMLLLLAVMVAFFARMVRWLTDQFPGNGLTSLVPEENDLDWQQPIRWDFYLGGMFGLLLGFVLRVDQASPNTVIAEAIVAGVRSVVWFAAFGLFERLEWSARGRALALTAGVLGLFVNLCVSGGIAFPSVAGPMWIAVALALNARSLEPSTWLSRPGPAMILPLPILGTLALGYGLYVFYPISSSDSLQREAVQRAAYFRAEGGKSRSIGPNPSAWLQKNVVDRLEQAARLTPEDARLQVQLARWYVLLWERNLLVTHRSDVGIAEKAILHAHRAEQLDPDGGQGYLAEYHLLMQFGSIKVEVAKNGPNRDPLHVHELEVTARQQYEKAAEVLERYLPNDPTSPQLQYDLARAWFNAGNEEKGREHAEAAQELDDKTTSPSRKLLDRQRVIIRKWLAPSSDG
jgi:hypothetical protein